MKNNATKPLNQMTLQELWQLFPIELVEHKQCWQSWYAKEQARINKALEGAFMRVSHVGSTAIPHIKAKNIVDILAEARDFNKDKDSITDTLTNKLGYTLMASSPIRVSFNRGYSPQGYEKKVFHLHLVPYGNADELYFLHYLVEHPTAAAQYETLKTQLAEQYKYDRDEYTRRKTEFVTYYTSQAKLLYGNRY